MPGRDPARTAIVDDSVSKISGYASRGMSAGGCDIASWNWNPASSDAKMRPELPATVPWHPAAETCHGAASCHMPGGANLGFP
jgi:hypothetical protein